MRYNSTHNTAEQCGLHSVYIIGGDGNDAKQNVGGWSTLRYQI